VSNNKLDKVQENAANHDFNKSMSLYIIAQNKKSDKVSQIKAAIMKIIACFFILFPLSTNDETISINLEKANKRIIEEADFFHFNIDYDRTWTQMELENTLSKYLSKIRNEYG
jgi:hypothetical protein